MANTNKMTAEGMVEVLEYENARLKACLGLLAIKARKVRAEDQLPEFRAEVMALLAMIDEVAP